MKTEPRTRAQWAQRINATHKAVVGACFKEFQKLGCELLAAKKALPHGEFLRMIESDLTVGTRAAQILMRVVSDKRLANCESDSHLPKAVSVLHELTRLPDEAIEQGIKDGTIHPDMTRSDAKKLTLKVVNYSHKIVSPYYVSETPEPPTRVVVPHYVSEPTPEPRELKLVTDQRKAENAVESVVHLSALSAALPQIEKLVSELVASVRRGDVAIDGAFEARIKILAQQLLSLTEKKVTTAH
jgi:hypothetical protein